MTSDARSSEWFDDIGSWSPTQRRRARGAAFAFVVLLALPLALHVLLPPAPSAAPAPLPAWSATDFASGDAMHAVEKHFKENSWVTFALRGAHDATLDALGIPRAQGTLGWFDIQTASGEILPLDVNVARARGFLTPVPWETPRPRDMVTPGTTFHLRYHDNHILQRDWFDAEGRVRCRINRYGLRERDEITEAKPAGQRRVVCLGDSLTFGWGVPEELCWVRLLENELRRDGSDVRTINCGGTMTVCADEYWFGLKNRFVAFQPDVVVMTLCLNDLIPSSGLFVMGPSSETKLSDVLAGKTARSPLDLDPTFPWVEKLLALPDAEGRAAGLYGIDKPFDAMWAQQGPQRAMHDAKAFCDQRGIRLVVTLWPFLQGLGPNRWYPFQPLHDTVAAFCATEQIELVDVLPALREIPQEDLWVTPADMHPNPKGHRLATAAIHRAVASALAR